MVPYSLFLRVLSFFIITLTATTAFSAAIKSNRDYEIIASHSQKCIAAPKNQTTSNELTQTSCIGNHLQRWGFARTQEGYRIIAHGMKSCLSVPHASRSIATPLVTADCGSTEGQIWKIEPNPKNRQQVRIVSQYNGLCLNIYGARTTDNTQLIQYSCSGAANEMFMLKAFPINSKASLGTWSPIIKMPLVPVGAAALPNGKVMLWSSWDRFDYNSGQGERNKTYTTTYDPATGKITDYLVTETKHDMFCPGTAMLEDGRVHIAGGGPDVATTTLYDYRSNQWRRDADMNEKRWYNTSVTLADGGVLTIGGHRKSKQTGAAEVWHEGKGWRYFPQLTMDPFLTNRAVNRSEEHPKLMLAPNGQLLAVGPTQTMHWYHTQYPGAITPAGTRQGDSFAQNGVFVQIDPYSALKAGGNPDYDGKESAANSSSSTSAYRLNLLTGQAQPVESMRYPRAYANGVVLPTGDVFISGGLDNGKAFSDNGAIMTPEIYYAKTRTWSTLRMQSVPRTYHSVALLLPDARILVGGGGLCGNCRVNHDDIEIFTPPYLLKGGRRPAILDAPSTLTYNQPFQVRANMPNWNISYFSLVRLSSVTHSTNTDQRYIKLSHRYEQQGLYHLLSPQNANLAPPGYYMLFLVSKRGVPSVSQIIQIKQGK